jgi:Antitoxin-like ribbon-helix-helix
MSGKRPSLAESMRAVAEAPASAPSAPPSPPAAAPAPLAGGRAKNAAERPKGFYAATRAGKKKATATLSAEAHRQLKLLALDHGGVEAVLTEAINDFFRKHGMEPIA